MYYTNIVDKCLENLVRQKKDYRPLEKLTNDHREAVHAAVTRLEDTKNEHSYEKVKEIRASFDRDEEEDDEFPDDDDPTASQFSMDDIEEDEGCSHEDDSDDCECIGNPEEQTIELYDKSQVYLEKQSIEGLQHDLHNWLSRILKSSENVKTIKICAEDEVDQLIDLRPRFPNLTQLLNQVIGAARLSAMTNAPFNMPALLIDGPPGVGKTYVVNEICKVLGLPLIKINMANLSGRFELVGGHRSYRDAAPGLLFTALFECNIANPVVLLDEAECGDPRLYQPLYHIAEGLKFRDHFLNIDFRVNAPNYVFVTNEKDLLPAPLRSRLTEFDASAPTLEEMRQIIQTIYAQVCSSSSLFSSFGGELSEECVNELLSSSLRVAKNRIHSGLLSSAASGSCDELLLEELKATGQSKHAKVGFLS